MVPFVVHPRNADKRLKILSAHAWGELLSKGNRNV